jgi:hypothetical protein
MKTSTSSIRNSPTVRLVISSASTTTSVAKPTCTCVNGKNRLMRVAMVSMEAMK